MSVLYSYSLKMSQASWFMSHSFIKGSWELPGMSGTTTVGRNRLALAEAHEVEAAVIS